MRKKQPRKCTSCGEVKVIQAHEWFIGCYTRWYRADMPPTGPPPPRKRARIDEGVIEDLQWLLKTGAPIEEAAKRVGIAVSTAKKRQRSRPEPVECAVQGCCADAFPVRPPARPRCAEHRDGARLYSRLRAGGRNRRQTALVMGVSVSATYRWEPGEPGLGRPRRTPPLVAPEAA